MDNPIMTMEWNPEKAPKDSKGTAMAEAQQWEW